MADLELVKQLDPKNKNYKVSKKLLDIFQFEKLTDAFTMLDGFGPVVDSFIREEMTKKPLKDLKATFL